MDKLIVANWKQNKNLEEVKSWLLEFKGLIDDKPIGNVKVVICPSASYLSTVSEFAKDYDWIFTGAQDVSVYERGSHTGEIGAVQLKDFVEFCIVGHSERAETKEQVIEKTEKCISNNIAPIICFENPKFLDQFQETEAYFLWEDPDTISGGGEYRPKPLDEIKAGVSTIIGGHDVSKGLLYGGSINKENASGLAKIEGLDGGVSGSASLDANHFYEIVKSFESIDALR